MQFTIAVLLIIIFPLLVDILAITYLFKNHKLSLAKKTGWIVLICVLPIFGALAYFTFLKFR